MQSRTARSAVLAVLAAAGLAPDLAAQAADSAGRAPTSPIVISGYVTASYTASSKPNGGIVVGRFFDRNHDQFTFDAAKVAIEKPVAPHRLGAGFRVDALAGQDAELTKASNFDLGRHADITQAYVLLNVPAGKDAHFQFRAGKWVTPMGLEVIEQVANPNFSEGNQFIFVEDFTQTGVGVQADWSKWSALVQVVNGWDVVQDNNRRKSYMGRLAYTPVPAVSLAVLGYTGPEQVVNVGHQRRGGEFLGTFLLGPAVTFIVQADVGGEDGLTDGGTGKAMWQALGGWLTVAASPKLSVAFRGDWVNDPDGVRTSNGFYPAAAARAFGSGTVTVNIKSVEHLLVRPELRWDHSSLADYGAPGSASHNQVTVALGTSYIF